MPPQRGQYPLCGHYPGSMSFITVGVVKCNYNLSPGRFLIVQMDLNAGDGKGLSVCELEAYEVNGTDQGCANEQRMTSSELSLNIMNHLIS